MKGVKAVLLSVGLLVVLACGGIAYKLVSWASNLKSSPSGLVSRGIPRPATDVEPLTGSEVVEAPFIFWGGDVATFHANGGLETTPDSIFGKQGLKIKLTPGDDFPKQVDDYLAGKSPFLRGTLSMLGQASEKLTAQPETTPVVFLQLTWSAGDHLVGRAGFKTLSDLKGKKIALQKSGPHVGMLNDILRTTRLTWRDVTVVWTEEVSGDKGPAARMRTDPSIDACFAISPEMGELTSAPETGGIDSVGDGSKKSIQGAHVVVSTAHMSRSIADVYACRKDFYDKNQRLVERFAAGYLKACEELVDAKKKADTDAKEKARYQQDIKLAQKIWGADAAFKDAVEKAEDVDGLISDAAFVGLPGNQSFFEGEGNLSGFGVKQGQAVELPENPAKQQMKSNPKLFLTADLDYDHLRTLGKLHGKAPSQPRIRAEAKIVAENTLFEFKILFAADKKDFPESLYGNDFKRALEQASLFGNTIIAIRGHADSANMVEQFVRAATAKGLGREMDHTFVLTEGKKVDLRDTKAVIGVIDGNPDLSFEYVERGRTRRNTLRSMVDYLQNLSTERADTVRQTIVDYAKARNLLLEGSQMRIEAVGPRESVGFSENQNQADENSKRNRRVEFRIIKVPLDQVNADEFDL